MRIGDIYRHKEYDNFICIHGFLQKFNEPRITDSNPLYICFEPLQIIDDEVAFCPSDLLYGHQEDIEKEYELYKDSDSMNIQNYKQTMAEIKEIMLKDDEEFIKKFLE